ncbi:hypothetical protein MD535_01035 [Vibrio sp. ZSDZ65]|uniref:Uncharacterized protein n=1 Tax=Vibrio qingdaonensis TaxID=2829491 RepID=A0A9X3CJI4_9VIBR|nr:hypothetical protein [Vibrio qingdaonensis]MCW8344613.1 hypothetical protein [Vibrio qingdaonensis]
MRDMYEMTTRTRIVTFALFVTCTLLWADLAKQVGGKVKVESTALTFVDTGYLGRDSTRNYYYFLDSGIKVRAPENNDENRVFLTEYLRSDYKCDVVYFENNSLINNEVNHC